MYIKYLVAIFLVIILSMTSIFAANELDIKLDSIIQQITHEIVQHQEYTIAVIEFSDIDGKTTAFGKYIAEELTTRLVSSKKFQVVERELLNKILQEHQLSLSGLIDSESAAQLGQLLGVSAIITGTITELDQNVKINARLIATESGGIITGASVDIKKDSDVTKLLNKVLTTSNFELSSNNLQTNLIDDSKVAISNSLPSRSPVPAVMPKESPSNSAIKTNKTPPESKSEFIKTESFTLNEEARIFAAPILSRYLYIKPDYNDAFNEHIYQWRILDASYGTAKYTFENVGHYYVSALAFKNCNLVPPSGFPDLSDIILELDGQFLTNYTGDWQVKIREGSKSECTIIIEGETARLTIVQEKNKKKIFSSSPNSFVKKGLALNHMKIIAKGPQIAVFINHEIIAYLKLVYSKTSNKGKISFQVSNQNDAPLQVGFGDLKIWDISVIPPW